MNPLESSIRHGIRPLRGSPIRPRLLGERSELWTEGTYFTKTRQRIFSSRRNIQVIPHLSERVRLCRNLARLQNRPEAQKSMGAYV